MKKKIGKGPTQFIFHPCCVYNDVFRQERGFEIEQYLRVETPTNIGGEKKKKKNHHPDLLDTAQLWVGLEEWDFSTTLPLYSLLHVSEFNLLRINSSSRLLFHFVRF